MRYWDFGANGKKGDVLSTFERTALRDGEDTKIRIEQEPGAGSKLLINQFRKNQKFKRYNIRGDKVKLKKNVRSFNLEALAEAGRVYWLKGEWNQTIIDHLVSFTGDDGKPDDITDSLTGSVNIWKKPKMKVIA